MKIEISGSKEELGERAAAEGAALIANAVDAQDLASIILATGASQFEMLDNLLEHREIDWSRVEAFHLDEYIGLPPDHPASFRRYLHERFIDRLPRPFRAFHDIRGELEPGEECERLARLIGGATLDVAFVGIGENGHLAFNDPPADFETDAPYIVARLDERCRSQQVGEGWFDSLEEVPFRAVSMSIRQIMKARSIICTVPEERKAKAVQRAVEGPVDPCVPASILQGHSDCRLFLDVHSASRLEGEGNGSAQAP